MVKPIGAHCNLACRYCYYLDKKGLYPEQKQHQMSDETLEQFIKQYIEAQTTPQILFTWHGGETFMRPLSFYQKAMQLQQRYGAGRQIDNCIQTNGTLVTPEWSKFLHDNRWLVGVSIDGPQEFHDEYRRTRDGRPSWAKVMHGIDMLNKYQVEWNAMAVVNDYNSDYPLDFYRFFRDELGCRFLQFTPIVETKPGLMEGDTYESTDESVSAEQWGNFLCEVFDEWVKNDVGEMFVQLFDATLANWMGVMPGVCSMAKDCGHAGVMEWNGDVYSCDHFVFPEYKLGNISQNTIYELMNSGKQMEFSKAKAMMMAQQCQECEWLFACNGECPKNRVLDHVTRKLVHPLSGGGACVLCEGYRRFFSHAAPYMDFMKQELLAGREARGVMKKEILTK